MCIRDRSDRDILFFGAGSIDEVNKYMSAVRLKLGEDLNLMNKNDFKFVWVTDFPLFIKDGAAVTSVHHPFTEPIAHDFNSDEILQVKSNAYDIVLNGTAWGRKYKDS